MRSSPTARRCATCPPGPIASGGDVARVGAGAARGRAARRTRSRRCVSALETEKSQPQQANARLVQTLQPAGRGARRRGDIRRPPSRAIMRRWSTWIAACSRSPTPIRCARWAGCTAKRENYPEAHTAYQEALEIEGQHVPRSDERIAATLQAIADTYRAQGDLAAGRRVLPEGDGLRQHGAARVRRSARDAGRTRAAARHAAGGAAVAGAAGSQSRRRLQRSRADLRPDRAGARRACSRPPDSADTIRTLLDLLAANSTQLAPSSGLPDHRALAWLAAARQAEQENDLDGARAACASALDVAANANLRWVIAQVLSPWAK